MLPSFFGMECLIPWSYNVYLNLETTYSCERWVNFAKQRQRLFISEYFQNYKWKCLIAGEKLLLGMSKEYVIVNTADQLDTPRNAFGPLKIWKGFLLWA